MSAIFDENTQFVDTGGKPLTGGSIYIGIVHTDPVLNPKNIFSDRALTTPLANPQTLDSYGRPTNKIWTDGEYSMQVDDINDVQFYQDLDAGQSASDIGVTGLSLVSGSNAITASATPTISSYVDLAQYSFKVSQINTGTVTLDIDSVGAKAIVKNGQFALAAGALIANQNVIVQYNSTNDNFQITNQSTNEVGYRTISGADTVDGADLGVLIDCTATLTLSLTAAATLGDRFDFYVKANGGAVTIDPNGAETIDGSATLELADGAYAHITCNGTSFFTVMKRKQTETGYRTISGADTVDFNDLGFLIDCTAALTLSLDPAATLGDKFSFHVKANGGAIVIDPNGAETIDGAATLTLVDGSSVQITCNGTNFFSVSKHIAPTNPWTYINEYALSAAAAPYEITGLSGWDAIVFEIMLKPSLDGDLYIQLGHGTTTWLTGSVYRWLARGGRINSGGSVNDTTVGDWSDTQIDLTTLSAEATGDVPFIATVQFQNWSAVTYNRMCKFQSVYLASSPEFVTVEGGGELQDTTNALTAIRFGNSGGGTLSGTILAYGRNFA